MTDDDEIIKQAKERFKQCVEYESPARNHYIFDQRFAEGDSDNLWQWPDTILRQRNMGAKPCLTINKTKQHCLQIINDARQNKPSVTIHPTGGGATFKASQIYEGIVRHIESISQASEAYGTATYCQVIGGIGYWRVTTDYANDMSMDQEIFVKRIADPLSVYLDPDIQTLSGEDMRYGFIYNDMARDQFDLEYPKWKDVGNQSPLGEEDRTGWISDHHIRVAEYYRKVPTTDTLHLLDNGMTVKESDVQKTPELMDDLQQHSVQSRELETHKIEWYLIAGTEIIDRKDWPGMYIPICRVIGEEVVVNGIMDRKGHVRALLDPQRMFNFFASSAVEHIALQTKSPFIAPVLSIEGYEREWANANTENLAILPYNHLDDTGTPIPPPERSQPPVYPPAYLDGLKVSEDQMMMASGQYQSDLGQQGNERSGKAINERQRQGENATYHYIDHLAVAIRYTGRIIIDLVPKVYDTQRTIKILAQDGSPLTVQLDPTHPQAHQDVQAADTESIDPQQIAAIFNPQVGYYDVEADIGPDYGTQRMEAFNALTQILSQNESLAPIVGDLLFRSADFPLADEIADRLKRMVPPQALGLTDPAVQQLQQQLAQQHQVMTAQSQQILELKSKGMTEELQKEIDWYKAETERLKAVGTIDPQAMMPVVRQMVSELLGVPVNQLIAAHTMENTAMLNAAQAQIAPPQQQQQGQPQ